MTDAELVEWLRARAARIRREIGGSSTADRLDRIAERISSRDDGLREAALGTLRMMKAHCEMNDVATPRIMEKLNETIAALQGSDRHG